MDYKELNHFDGEYKIIIKSIDYNDNIHYISQIQDLYKDYLSELIKLELSQLNLKLNNIDNYFDFKQKENLSRIELLSNINIK
jgi:hypothetical protein